MEELPREEQSRLLKLLSEDDKKRNRGAFHHSFEIIENNWACQYSIWPMPNDDAFSVIHKRSDYGSYLAEDLNEVEKGMLFQDQREFIAKHIKNGDMLCEAREYTPCFQEKCPLFAPRGTESGGEYGICREFKIAFRKK